MPFVNLTLAILRSAHAAFLRGILINAGVFLGIESLQKCGGFGLFDCYFSALSDKLIKGWHITPPHENYMWKRKFS
jgi:hypothetical protein